MSDYDEICKLYMEKVEVEIKNFHEYIGCVGGESHKEINGYITHDYKTHQTNTEIIKNSCLHEIYELHRQILEPFTNVAEKEIKDAKKEYNDTVELAAVKRDVAINKINTTLKKETQQHNHSMNRFIKITNNNALIIKNTLKDIYKQARNEVNKSKIKNETCFMLDPRSEYTLEY